MENITVGQALRMGYAALEQVADSAGDTAIAGIASSAQLLLAGVIDAVDIAMSNDESEEDN